MLYSSEKKTVFYYVQNEVLELQKKIQRDITEDRIRQQRSEEAARKSTAELDDARTADKEKMALWNVEKKCVEEEMERERKKIVEMKQSLMELESRLTTAEANLKSRTEKLEHAEEAVAKREQDVLTSQREIDDLKKV